MFTRFSRQSPQPGFGYGYGWLVTKILGRPILMVAGGGPGSPFVTVYFRLPADGLTLIMMTNQGAADYMATVYAIIWAMVSPLVLSDLIFILTAIAFLLLLAVLLATQENRRVKTTWVTGVLWFLLAVPLALVFSRYLAEGRGVWTLIALGLVLLYMLVKALLDFVFRVDFERNRIARLVTLVLMCLALFCLIWIAFGIHASWGTPVLVAFGILVVSLIFTYRERVRVRK